MGGWVQLFGQPGNLDVAQECARALLVFAFGFAAVRLVGRRVFGKWAALDIVVSIIIGSNLSRTLTGNAPLIGTLVATTLLLALHFAMAQAAARSRRLARWIEGSPVHLYDAGAVRFDRLARWSISEADLNTALREKGLSNLKQVHTLILEPNGTISVLGASPSADQPEAAALHHDDDA